MNRSDRRARGCRKGRHVAKTTGTGQLVCAACGVPVCTCRSGGGGETILPRPDWLPDGERLNGVPVDPCIAPVVEALWSAGIRTIGSCCGHNLQPPSLVLTEGPVDSARVHDVIATVDQRRFTLHQWQLVALPADREEPTDA